MVKNVAIIIIFGENFAKVFEETKKFLRSFLNVEGRQIFFRIGGII